MSEWPDTVDGNLVEAVETLQKAHQRLGRCVQLLVQQNGDRTLTKAISAIHLRVGKDMDAAWDIADERGSAYV